MDETQNNRLLARAIIVSQFAPPFMFSGVAVVLPTMGAELHAGAISLGLVETLFLASQLAFLLAVGRLADSSDKRTLYKYGLLCFGFSALLISMLSSIPGILALRFVQGMTSAIFAATGPAILAEIVPAEKRGRAYGSSIGAIYAGLTLGPLIAGYLNDHFGWRALFMAGGILLVLASLLVIKLMPSRWRHPPKGAIHLPSTALIVLCSLCLVAGSSLANQGMMGFMALSGGIMLGALFVWWQLRLPQPLLNIRAMVKNKMLCNSLLVQLLLYISAASTVFLLSLYLQVSMGQTAKTVGQIIAAGTVLMVIVAPLSGRLADRYPPHLVSCCGVICVLVSSLMGVTLHADSSLWFITGMFTLQGIGFALFSSPNMTIIMNSVPPAKTSMASALGAKARSLGMMTGMLIATLLVSFHYGNTPVNRYPERFITIPGTAYAILSALTGLALMVCLLTRSRKAKR